MKNVIIPLFIVLLFNSCKKEEDISLLTKDENISANFSYDIIIRTDSPNVYKFKNLSTGATNYRWYFGNGDSSNAFEPTYVFTKLDSFRVTLIATNGNHSISKNKLIYVTNIASIDSNKIPVIDKNPIADFNIIYNVDSANIVHLKNLSTDYIKSTWIFGDNFSSHENNVTHIYSSVGNRAIKLIVENKYAIKDSITINFSPILSNNIIDLPDYSVISTNPIKYLFEQLQVFTNSSTISHISFTDYYQENPDKFTVKQDHTFSDFSPHSYITYWKNGKTTAYKKYITKDFTNISSIFSKATGTYNFNSRIEISERFPSPTDTTNYKDTVLNVTLLDNAKLELRDDALNHLFHGYLSSESNNNEYVFKLNNSFIPITGPITTTYMRIPINSNTINIHYQSNSGTKLRNETNIFYNGAK